MILRPMEDDVDLCVLRQALKELPGREREIVLMRFGLEGYQELLGLSGHKPFECVGEISESRWAFHQLVKRKDWQDDSVLQALAKEVPVPDEGLIFTPSLTHLIPEDLKNVLDEFK